MARSARPKAARLGGLMFETPGRSTMSAVTRACAAVICLVLSGTLAGCAKSDQQVCSDKGISPGTAMFADCLQHETEKHALVEQQQEARDRALRSAADSPGRMGPSCGGSPDRLGCTSGY